MLIPRPHSQKKKLFLSLSLSFSIVGDQLVVVQFHQSGNFMINFATLPQMTLMTGAKYSGRQPTPTTPEVTNLL